MLSDNTRYFLKREEAAQMLQISVRTLDKLTKAKQIPHLRVGRQVRFPIAALNEWVQENMIMPGGDA